ncbi:hypothetical protein EVAR_17818_1 [Eumeta japonica]|uniref:Uncharacterized protein n=1 Tax=Eumeta variegata TaxID=151549 RepID=A0A4C1TTI4_EUMVA|nr:hypothetical protein EVAR_17818_1 [Eumeta japonica]
MPFPILSPTVLSMPICLILDSDRNPVYYDRLPIRPLSSDAAAAFDFVVGQGFDLCEAGLKASSMLKYVTIPNHSYTHIQRAKGVGGRAKPLHLPQPLIRPLSVIHEALR